MTEIFERDARFIQPGLGAKVSLSHQEGSFTGVVSDVLHPFDETTRTFMVRIEVDNPDYRLRPNMFADVEFAVELPPVITVAADAVMDSGLGKTVFVSLGGRYFEPRRVEIGRRIGQRAEILAGLRARESVVVGSTFLVDSESRMRTADAARRGGPPTYLLCPMEPGMGHGEDSHSEFHARPGGGHHH